MKLLRGSHEFQSTYRHLDPRTVGPAGCHGVLTGSPWVSAAVWSVWAEPSRRLSTPP